MKYLIEYSAPYSLALSLIAVTTMMFAGRSFAQDRPCTPDCPEKEWSPVQFISITLAPEYPDCTVNVGYVERESCNGKRDFQIVGPYSFPRIPACEMVWQIFQGDGDDAARLLHSINHIATNALILAHFSSLAARPDCGTSVRIYYRVLQARCFIRISQSEEITQQGLYGIYITERCGESCCLRVYSACDDPDTGTPRIERVGSTDQEPVCPRSRLDPERHCHSLCYD